MDKQQGVTYPALQDLSDALASSANVGGAFEERLDDLVPEVGDVVLLFSGNRQLTTSASALSGDTKGTAPNAVKQDAVLKGVYSDVSDPLLGVTVRSGDFGLFGGQATAKQLLWMVLPGLIVLFVSVVVLSLKASNNLTSASFRTLIKRGCSTAWHRQPDIFIRLLLHGNRFALSALTLGALMTTFYAILAMMGFSPFHCVMWNVDIGALGDNLFPWPRVGIRTQETLPQWLFVLFVIGLDFATCRFWGDGSSFTADTHLIRARRIYIGIRTIHGLEQCSILSYKCIDRWAMNALSVGGLHDFDGRRARSKTKMTLLRVFFFWLLQIPAALLICWPSLLFALSQNVASNNAILAVCRTSIVAVILMTVMKAALLRPMVRALAWIHEYGTVHDVLSFNTQRSKALFFVQFLAYAFLPVIVIFLIDGMHATLPSWLISFVCTENCGRYVCDSNAPFSRKNK